MCLLHTHFPESHVTHCGLLIGAGTRDESPGKEGLAHFIEHSLFKGTKRRKSFHILNRLEVVGGELNAYTTKEETCIHASVMHQYLERAVDLIADIAFDSIFPLKEIEKEKDVITDEIRSYQDTPYEQIFDDFEGLIFKGHPLGHPILGTEESIRKFKRKDLVNYIETLYDPARMVFAISGNISPEEAIKLAEQYFGKRKFHKKRPERIAAKGYRHREVEDQRNVNQVHYIMGRPTIGLKHPDRYTMVLFNNLLGGPGMNSKLNLNIREKYGFTYTIESGYHTYSDTGIFHVYFATDQKHFSKTKLLMDKELDKICENRIGQRQFNQYQEQLLGQIRLVQENRLSVLLSMAKSQLNLGRIITMKEITARIEEVSPVRLQEVAVELLNPSKRSVLVYQPK